MRLHPDLFVIHERTSLDGVGHGLRPSNAVGTESKPTASIRGRIAGRVGGSAAVRLRRKGLVRREGGEPFGLRLALVAQEVNQTPATCPPAPLSGRDRFPLSPHFRPFRPRGH